MLLHWSDGLIEDHPPCWEELLRVLFNVGLENLSSTIYDLLQVQGMYVQDPRDGFGDYHSSSPERSQQRSQQP